MTDPRCVDSLDFGEERKQFEGAVQTWSGEIPHGDARGSEGRPHAGA